MENRCKICCGNIHLYGRISIERYTAKGGFSNEEMYRMHRDDLLDFERLHGCDQSTGHHNCAADECYYIAQQFDDHHVPPNQTHNQTDAV